MWFQDSRAGRILSTASFFIGALLVGCGSDGAPKGGLGPPQPAVVRVLITPETVSLQPGMAQQFTANGQLSDGSTTAISAAFLSTGGPVTGDGLYTAGSIPGNYQVIAVEQSGTLADTASVIISATPDLAPTANANGPYSGIAGSPIAFSSAGSSDPEGAWTAAWDFGDGATATGTNPSHSYSSAGSYTATLTVTDQVGQTASDVATVTVTSGPGPTTLLQESFDDGSLTGRGWYDMISAGLTITAAEAHSGNGSVEFTFPQGGTVPQGGHVARHLFPESESVRIEYWVKYSANWRGSGVLYHPHEWVLMTNLDRAYIGPGATHLTAYVEHSYQTGGLVPVLALQDALNTDINNIGVDLTGVTELRSAQGCNGLLDFSQTSENCFQLDPSTWYSARIWKKGGMQPGIVAITDANKVNWNKIEAYYQLNSIVNGVGVPDGVLRYWLNGVLLMEHTGVLFRTGDHPSMRFNQLLIGPYIGDGSPVTQTIWYDDLVVTTGP